MENISVESTTPVYTMGITSGLSEIPIPSIRQYIDKRFIIPAEKNK